MISYFQVSKMMNCWPEAIGAEFIRLYYYRKGFKYEVYENSYEDLPGKRGYDRRVTNGDLWEIKVDSTATRTENVYIERTVDDSKSNMFLRCVDGMWWATTKEAIQQLLQDFTEVTPGGDNKRAMGTLVPKNIFYSVSEWVEPGAYIDIIP